MLSKFVHWKRDNSYTELMGRLDLHYTAVAGHMTSMSWTARKSSDIAG